MHELSIAVKVIETALKAIPASLYGQPVEKITLDIGKMSCVTSESLKFCIEVASKGTVFEAAELVVNEIPVILECRDCLARWDVIEPEFLCLKCGSPGIRMVSGRELMIRSMEVREKSI